MTTPTSSLGMSAIQTEFGGSNPISLSEYYGVNANVAASGTIRMAQFLGISNFAASTPDMAPVGYGLSGTMSAYCYIANDGGYDTYENGGLAQSGTWKTGGGSASDYDVRYTKTAGLNPGGDSTNTWLNLATTREWHQTRGTVGINQCSGTLEIRLAASPFTVLDSSTLSLWAEYDM